MLLFVDSSFRRPKSTIDKKHHPGRTRLSVKSIGTKSLGPSPEPYLYYIYDISLFTNTTELGSLQEVQELKLHSNSLTSIRCTMR